VYVPFGTFVVFQSPSQPELLGIHAVLDGHEPPLRLQVDDVVLGARPCRLGCPGGQRRQFGRAPRRGPSMGNEVLLDLGRMNQASGLPTDELP
jgi:hypothetical protein